MLTNLSLENFKSWRRIDNMRLAPITGLFGANSSGKTSILQSLLLLDQTVESSDWQQVLDFGDEKSYVQLGTFKDVVFGHASQSHLGWSMTFKLQSPLRIVDPETRATTLFEDEKVTFSARVEEDDGRLLLRRMSYMFADHAFKLELRNGTEITSRFHIGLGTAR